MKLEYVKIENFRSIKSMRIDFNDNCRILVGINESGKSNILKALKLIDESDPDTKDIRIETDDEIKESYVRFVFSINENNKKNIITNLNKIILQENDSTPLLTLNGKNYSSTKLIEENNEVLFISNIKSEITTTTFWNFGNYKAVSGWKKPSSACPDAFTIKVGNKEFLLKQFPLIHFDFVKGKVPIEYLSDIAEYEIKTILRRPIRTEYISQRPECIFWTYDDMYLLPSKINIEKFKADPDICIPLKNMFELYGITEIEEAIDKANSRPHGFRSLLEKISSKTTKHIKSVWKEYKSIEILLEPNGPEIDASVKDTTNRYSFSDRSDGFKRFVSFLLIISTKVHTKTLTNNLILLDEPEISLHPSGARYLLDELLKISKTNYVVFSTHSIFMIDKDKIDHHLIIEKKDEETIAKQADTSNFQDEEVIFNALGHSIFSSLREKNIVFEGWKDKKLFKVALSKIPSKHSGLKNKFLNVGLTHCQGVKDVARLASLLDLADRGYLVISDDDKPAKDAQKAFTATNGKWKRYGELMPENNFITSEDFIKPQLFYKAISNFTEYKNLKELPLDALESSIGKIAALRKWMHQNSLDEQIVSKFVNDIKNYVFDKLSPSDIEPIYYELLDKIDLNSI